MKSFKLLEGIIIHIITEHKDDFYLEEFKRSDQIIYKNS